MELRSFVLLLASASAVVALPQKPLNGDLLLRQEKGAVVDHQQVNFSFKLSKKVECFSSERGEVAAGVAQFVPYSIVNGQGKFAVYRFLLEYGFIKQYESYHVSIFRTKICGKGRCGRPVVSWKLLLNLKAFGLKSSEG